MLEQIAYEVPGVLETKQRVYQVGDLESLSSTVLYGYGYNGKSSISMPRAGMTLSGGLTIKKVGRNTISLQEDFGGVGNLYTVHPDGHGALRFYGLGEGKAKEKKTNSW